MDPIIDLAPGAEDNPLAARLAQLIRDNLARDSRRLAEFRGIRGAVLVVAQDTGTSLTLRFDHGRLTLHDGAIGVPSVTFCGDEAALRRLPRVAFHRRLRFPVLGLLHRESGAALRELATEVARGDLKIYGLLAHPRLVLTLLRLISDPG
ncbi:MAG: hypothetical protein IT372_27625 [Polyangiaceae bacterium]|nr:hypothetical protein [Polyangiaceae bacterium]